MASKVWSSCLTIPTDSSGPAKPPIRSTVGRILEPADREASMTVPFSVRPTSNVSAATGKRERSAAIVSETEGTPEVRLAFVVAKMGATYAECV